MKYDLAVIGGGPAGYSAALLGAEKGLKVILFEEKQIGGTCLNRGCVPTKFWAHAAELYCQVQGAARYGVKVEDVAFDYFAAKKSNENIVAQLRNGLEQKLRQGSVTLISNRAYINADHMVDAGKERYEADHVLIATGSRPVAPFLPRAISSDELLEYDHLPRSARIIGGGVVAVEFAHILNSLGVKVTMCLRGERILRRWDREIAVGCTQILKSRGVVIRPSCTQDQMREGDEEIVLSAVGRVPNLEGVFAPELGIKTDEGGIVADASGITNIAGIYAAGDVVSGSPLLAHTAMSQGRQAVEHMLGLQVSKETATLKCIYVQPEIASVGMTETEAKAEGIQVISAKQMMYANARTMISTGERGFIKLVADIRSRRIVGAQLMCERASDIAAELALAINTGMTADEFARTIRPHPSFCEEVTTAARSLLQKMS